MDRVNVVKELPDTRLLLVGEDGSYWSKLDPIIKRNNITDKIT